MSNTAGIDVALAETLFADLARIGADGVGISRETYGPGENQALDRIEAAATALGLTCARDAAANLVCTLPGTDPALPAIACGSHLDSVPQGGNYDGAAGVVAGLLALGQIAAGPRPRRSLMLYGLRGEESAWYGKPYLGSGALFGALGPEDLAAENLHGGQRLDSAMQAAGADIARIAAGERLLDPASLAAFIELHIEQGPVLVARHLPLAIVTGIRGNFRHRGILCRGEAGHSGAVPRWLRHDAVFAVADLIGHMDRHWQALLAQGQDLVITAGIAGTDPAEHAVSRIPGQMRFSFEARSENQATLDSVHQLLEEECRAVGEERGVRFIFDRRINSAPALMDPALIARMVGAAGRLGLPAETMASGAGHDAAMFANAGIPAAMIFVRNAHGSHNPQEAMDMADFLAGTALMAASLRDLAA